MKQILILLILLTTVLHAEKVHPLEHPNFQIMESPVGKWDDGYIYIHDVLKYLFKSENERSLAKDKLSKIGFSDKDINYFYMVDNKYTINGKIFDDIKTTKEYLKTSRIRKIRVFTTEEQFPNELKTVNIEFYLIPWDKRDLPKKQL